MKKLGLQSWWGCYVWLEVVKTKCRAKNSWGFENKNKLTNLLNKRKQKSLRQQNIQEKTKSAWRNIMKGAMLGHKWVKDKLWKETNEGNNNTWWWGSGESGRGYLREKHWKLKLVKPKYKNNNWMNNDMKDREHARGSKGWLNENPLSLYSYHKERWHDINQENTCWKPRTTERTRSINVGEWLLSGCSWGTGEAEDEKRRWWTETEGKCLFHI